MHHARPRLLQTLLGAGSACNTRKIINHEQMVSWNQEGLNPLASLRRVASAFKTNTFTEINGLTEKHNSRALLPNTYLFCRK